MWIARYKYNNMCDRVTMLESEINKKNVVINTKDGVICDLEEQLRVVEEDLYQAQESVENLEVDLEVLQEKLEYIDITHLEYKTKMVNMITNLLNEANLDLTV